MRIFMWCLGRALLWTINVLKLGRYLLMISSTDVQYVPSKLKKPT